MTIQQTAGTARTALSRIVDFATLRDVPDTFDDSSTGGPNPPTSGEVPAYEALLAYALTSVFAVVFFGWVGYLLIS